MNKEMVSTVNISKGAGPEIKLVSPTNQETSKGMATCAPDCLPYCIPYCNPNCQPATFCRPAGN